MFYAFNTETDAQTQQNCFTCKLIPAEIKVSHAGESSKSVWNGPCTRHKHK